VRSLLLILILACPALTGCIHVDRGGTVINVRTDDEAKEARIRHNLWRVDKAVEEVKWAYGLTDIPVEVIVTHMGGLGQTMPALDGLGHTDGAIVTINEIILLEPGPDTDLVLLGLFAHELAHAMHYDRMHEGDLIELGTRYNRYMKTEGEALLEWVRAYEQLTDMTVIALGHAEALVHQKRASEANIAQNHPQHVWGFYLTEEEIVALDADRAELNRRMAEALAMLQLSSLHFVAADPVYDEYGFLTGWEATPENAP